MDICLQTSLERARAKCEEIERELRKYPDFQLYLLTTSRKDRARMERLLKQIPAFQLWHELVKLQGTTPSASVVEKRARHVSSDTARRSLIARGFAGRSGAKRLEASS